MAQEDDPQQGSLPSSGNKSASSEPKAAAHMANSSAPQAFVMGSSDPDSTSVYVQAAAQSRKRAAHMDRQKGIELEVDSMMDEITGSDSNADSSSSAPQQAPQQTEDHHARKARKIRFANRDNTTGKQQLSATSGVAIRTQRNAQSSKAGNSPEGALRQQDEPSVAQGPTTPDTPSEPIDQDTNPAQRPTPATVGTSAAANGSTGKYEPDVSSNPYDDGKPTPRGKRKRHLGLVITCIVVAIVAGVAAFGLWYLHDINSRLNDNLDTDLTSELAQTPAGDPFYLLLLGTDKDEERAEGSEYGNSDSAYRSDSIMLARIDPKNVKVTLVSIHRDTMVDLGDYGVQKINAAYSIGGPSYATQVISDFAGVKISHYAEIDMDRFAKIVDQVGGVTVNLPIAVKDPDYTGLDLEAGEQTLDGQTAALLCRARHAYDAYGDGDRYRAANQRIVMQAVVQKVLASDPATMVSTITTMADSVTTDMTLTEILTLASQMKGLNVSTDVMSGMEPTTSEYVDQTWYEIVDEDAWKQMMDRVDSGLSPSESSDDDEMTQDVAATMAGDDSGNDAESNANSSSTSSDSSDSN